MFSGRLHKRQWAQDDLLTYNCLRQETNEQYTEYFKSLNLSNYMATQVAESGCLTHILLFLLLEIF